MAASAHSAIWKTVRKIWQTLGAIKTGVVLLILVVIISAAGTVILQRPATEADEMQRAYSPQVLRLLDWVGLTDVFHAWWFVFLLSLVSLSIIAASLQRFPNAWRFFSRPYKSTDESFRNALPNHALIPIKDEAQALSVAERAFHKAGFRPEHIVRENSFSLFGERNRFSELAVYIVHASLLLIFLGGIVDALYGWRAFVTLNRGQQSSQVQMQDGSQRNLGFAVRCDGAGQENYADGTPKRWWSDLVVLENGQAVVRKQIVVNDPLVYRGIRFYQASYGKTGKIDKLVLTATPQMGKHPKTSQLPKTRLFRWILIPPSVSQNLFPTMWCVMVRFTAAPATCENPAAHLVVESRKSHQAVNFRLPAIRGFPIDHFGLESTPLVADGVMYVTGPNQAIALDASTGRQIWKYSRPGPRTFWVTRRSAPIAAWRSWGTTCSSPPTTRTCWR